MTRPTLLVAVVAAVVATTASAQSSFNYPTFASVAGISFVGTGSQVGAVARITNTVSNQTGGFWHQTPVTVVAGFDTTCTFRIVPGPTLAEGIAFVIQDAPTGASTLGGTVWSLGYGVNVTAGIPNSVAIEIDTFADGFLGDIVREVSVHTRGTQPNNENESFSIGRFSNPTSLADGAVHTLRVRYIPGTLEVYTDNLVTPKLSVAYDLMTGGSFLSGGAVGGLALPNGTARLGFVGTTGAGGLTERAELLSWSFTGSSLAPACLDGTIGVGFGGPFDVVQVNGSSGGLFRRVEVPTFEPFTLGLVAPPGGPTPAPFLLLAKAGTIDGTNTFATPFGPLCFHPFAATAFPVADTFGVFPGPLPATPAPWSVLLPGISVVGAFTLQGIIADGAGFAVTNGLTLEFVPAAAPAITLVAPLSAPAGTPIVLTGSGFSSLATVTINGSPITPTSMTSTQITFPYPVGLPCGSQIEVTNPDTQSDTAPINPNVTLSNSTPSGLAAGGSVFFVVGSGFAPGTTVTIGGAAATITTVTAGAVIGSIPPGTVGPTTLVVTTPGGCSGSRPFTYL